MRRFDKSVLLCYVFFQYADIACEEVKGTARSILGDIAPDGDLLLLQEA